MNLAKINVEDLLETLGVLNVERATADEVTFSCPFPGHAFGDETPSAYMNTGEIDESKATLWYCHGCKSKGNAVSFLSLHENVSKQKATTWLRSQYDSTFREPKGGSFSAEWDDFFMKKEQNLHINEPLDEDLVQDVAVEWFSLDQQMMFDYETVNVQDECPQYAKYMFKRGFSYSILNQWDIGWSSYDQRVTIPIRNKAGHLVGFKGRAIDDEVKPKYKLLGDKPMMNRGYGFTMYDPQQVVFGLDKAEGDSFIVVEGELNVIAMHQMGFTNTIGLGGSNLSQRQVDLIKGQANEIIIYLDTLRPRKEKDGQGPAYYPDGAGITATANLIKALEPFIKVRVTDFHIGDPADALCGIIDREDIEKLIDNSTSSLSLSIPF